METHPSPEPRHDDWWIERFEGLNTRYRNWKGEIVFLGDSITEMWEWPGSGKKVWDKYWAPRKAANFGISGDCVEHVLWRLDHGNLDGLDPKVIVLLIGTNNTGMNFSGMGYRCSAGQTADGVKAIIERLKTKCSDARILLMAILPSGERSGNPVRMQNEATNAILKTFADEKTVHWMDIGSKLTKPDGDLSAEIAPDMLHLSEAGYAIWAEALEPKVEELIR